MTTKLERELRQRLVRQWTIECFGIAVADNVLERVSRLFEEVVELAQAEQVPVETMHKIIAHVYSKPIGNRAQEVGGISITLLAYCALQGFSADECEHLELTRIINLPKDHFRQRQMIKAQAGIAKS